MTAQDQPMGFAEWLRDTAERRGYPLSESGRRAGGATRLANDAGLPQSVVSRMLNGSTNASPETALKLARPLLVRPSEVLDRAGHHALAQYFRDLAGGADVPPAGQVLERIAAADLDEATKRRLAAAYQREISQVAVRLNEMIETALNAKREALAKESDG